MKTDDVMCCLFCRHADAEAGGVAADIAKSTSAKDDDRSDVTAGGGGTMSKRSSLAALRDAYHELQSPIIKV